jgi:mannose-6-phosphate isomerase-like protein (cupin superfamily)
MEMTMPAGIGPPPHTHPGTETVYVLEGSIRYYIGDDARPIDGGPGTLFHIPAGVLERFEPTTTAKVLVTYAPGGIERFFAEAGEVAERYELPPPPTEPPDVERLAAIAERYGMHIQTPSAV